MIDANTLRLLSTPSLKVVVNDTLCVSHEWQQYRFPKTKKVRIRNKWKKDSCNYKLKEVHKYLKIGDAIYVSSKVYDYVISMAKADLFSKENMSIRFYSEKL